MQPNNSGPGWFKYGLYKVAGTAETFKGQPTKIVLSDTVRFYDDLGRELLPVGAKEPQPLTAEQLFWGGRWAKQ